MRPEALFTGIRTVQFWRGSHSAEVRSTCTSPGSIRYTAAGWDSSAPSSSPAAASSSSSVMPKMHTRPSMAALAVLATVETSER